MTGITLRRRIAALVAGARPGLGVLADVAAAVTGRTLAGQASVIHRPRQERCRAGMAGVALAIVWNMRPTLAQRRRAVVTGRALAGRRRIVREGGGLPGRGGVADIALGSGRNVGGRLRLRPLHPG